jgi:VanZ family protein
MIASPSLRRLSLWLPPIAYMAFIFYLSSQTDPLPALTVRVWDKLLHLAEYGGLAFLIGRALTGEGSSLGVASVLAFLATSIYGASDEWHQLFTPGRSSDVYDWLADTLGGAFGVASYAVTIYLSTLLHPRHRLRR